MTMGLYGEGCPRQGKSSCQTLGAGMMGWANSRDRRRPVGWENLSEEIQVESAMGREEKSEGEAGEVSSPSHVLGAFKHLET